jgi:TolB-like protein/class 3 adenylate cyclase/Flp pilus assembly protein TadD
MERRLTAIFALDMVGYGRLMELDEAHTLARHESAQSDLFDSALARHHGRTVKRTGDGLLAEFPSAVDAVECAAEIQRGMAEREADVPLERRIAYRIGIAIGDIVAKDGDIYGNGVIIAARIESLAGPGEILVSDHAYGQVHNKVEMGFEDLGPHTVKNLQKPLHVYRALWDPGAASGPIARAWRRSKSAATVMLLAAVALVTAWLIVPDRVAFEPVPSIAVLPFVNMSSDPEQEYFSDGITEELLNLLGQIPELQVAARTSSFSFKGQNLEIPEIADRLNVAHVLEGSVRKDGDEVRITAQLIRADDGFHVWSDSWDRTLDDIFQVQDDIAADVVAQLRVTLLGDAPSLEATDPEAYALYLQARQLSHRRTADAFEQSVALYRDALAIDPEYSTAWAGLAGTYAFQTGAYLLPFDEGYRLAHEAANRALAIDSENAEAHAYLGYIAMHHENDMVAAARHYEQALNLAPTNPDIMALAARLASNLGLVEEAVRLMEYVVARDPLNPGNHTWLGSEYRRAGRLEESIASFQTALELSPGQAGAYYAIGVAHLLMGEPEEALQVVQMESTEWYRLTGLVLAYHALGRAEESDAALQELIEKHERGWSYQVAYALAYRGEADRAFEWLDRAAEYNDPGLAEISRQSLFSNLYGDPRWLPYLESIGKSPTQLSEIDFEVRLLE